MSTDRIVKSRSGSSISPISICDVTDAGDVITQGPATCKTWRTGVCRVNSTASHSTQFQVFTFVNRTLRTNWTKPIIRVSINNPPSPVVRAEGATGGEEASLTGKMSAQLIANKPGDVSFSPDTDSTNHRGTGDTDETHTHTAGV